MESSFKYGTIEKSRPQTFETNLIYTYENMSCVAFSPYTYNERILYGTMGAILSAYIFLVNLFLFIIFLKDRKVRRVPGHMFIVGLMVSSDVIIGLVPLPGYLFVTLCGGWPLAPWTCDFWITIDYISTNVSMVSVTTVAFDRFLATNFVFSHKRWMHQTNQIRLCVALWIFTAVRNILVFPIWANVSEFRSHEAPGKCGHPIYSNFTMGILQRTIALYIPVVLLFVFYAAVVFRILQSSPHFQHNYNRGAAMATVNLNTNSASGGRTIRDTASPAHSTSNGSTGGINRLRVGCPSSPLIARSTSPTGGATYTFNNKDTRITQTTIATPRSSTLARRISKSFRIVTCVILSFLLANLPWHIIENMIASGATKVKKTDSLYILFYIMNYINAFFNPIFYMFMHVEYKRTIFRWIRCRPYARTTEVNHRCGASSAVVVENSEEYGENLDGGTLLETITSKSRVVRR